MAFKLESNQCPVCGKYRGRGGHPTCSKKLQKLAGPDKATNNRNGVYKPKHIEAFLRVIDKRGSE